MYLVPQAPHTFLVHQVDQAPHMFLVHRADQEPHMFQKVAAHVEASHCFGLPRLGPHMFLAQVQLYVFYLIRHLLVPRHIFPIELKY